MDVAGDGGKFQQYLDVQSRFTRYSAVNALLVLAQMPEAKRLGDYDHWKDRGGQVKRSPVSVSILEPHEYAKEDGTVGIGYNIKKVFDISQVDTRKMKAISPQSYDNRQLLKALVNKAPVKITGVDDLPHDRYALTRLATGEILVRKGMEFADTFRSVAQELAFAELTAGPDTRKDATFSAHCASYILCKKYGVDTKGFSFEGSPSVFNGMDAKEVKGELSQIRDVAETISSRMAKQLGAAQKAARAQEAR